MTTPDRIKLAMRNAKILQDEAADLKKGLSDLADEVKAERENIPSSKDPS